MLGSLQFGEHKRKEISLQFFTMYYKHPNSQGRKKKHKEKFPIKNTNESFFFYMSFLQTFQNGTKVT